MARKIKLPLDMGNDIKVRDMEELRANYNSEKVVESFLNGELLPWLQDRFYEEEAERVESLSADKDSGNIAGRLAEIFGVQIESEVDVDEIAERNERLAKLRSITSDDEVLRNIDLVAFSQEDMDIVHESDVIYLCGDKFRIPYNVKNKRYIGVNEPLVEIKAEGEIDLENHGIVIENCRFTEEMLSKLSEKEEPKVNDIPEADDIFGEIGRYYSPKGAKGDLASFKRVNFNDEYIEKIGYGEKREKNEEYSDRMGVLHYENTYIYISGNKFLKMYGLKLMNFKNCVIHMGACESIDKFIKYEYSGDNKYIFNIGGIDVKFFQCTFIFDECGIVNHQEEHDYHYGIDLLDTEKNIFLFYRSFSSNNTNAIFNDCLFIHSNYLMNVSYSKDSFNIKFNRCHFINCYVNFCCYPESPYDGGKIYIQYCAIYQDGKDMSFYNERNLEDGFSKIGSDVGRNDDSISSYIYTFKSRLDNLVLFPLSASKYGPGLFNTSKYYLLSAGGNLIMQPQNLDYLKDIVRNELKKHDIDFDEQKIGPKLFDWNEKYQPKIFPSNQDESIFGTSYADPSDREALDEFFKSKESD